jgi:hypothetical protein
MAAREDADAVAESCGESVGDEHAQRFAGARGDDHRRDVADLVVAAEEPRALADVERP